MLTFALSAGHRLNQFLDPQFNAAVEL